MDIKLAPQSEANLNSLKAYTFQLAWTSILNAAFFESNVKSDCLLVLFQEPRDTGIILLQTYQDVIFSYFIFHGILGGFLPFSRNNILASEWLVKMCWFCWTKERWDFFSFLGDASRFEKGSPQLCWNGFHRQYRSYLSLSMLRDDVIFKGKEHKAKSKNPIFSHDFVVTKLDKSIWVCDWQAAEVALINESVLYPQWCSSGRIGR